MHILSPQDKVSLTFTTSERVVLTCELSRVDFPASWYKDGQKVKESESLVVKMDGRKHRLIMPEAQVQDSGEFECRTEGVSAFFSVSVQGQGPWRPGLPQAEADPGGCVNPAPLVCLLEGPFRRALGGKGTCLQITLPMHHPPAHLAPM